jgi:hypothetical protein
MQSLVVSGVPTAGHLASTSSKLVSTLRIEKEITQSILEYCGLVLANSKFFSELRQNNVSEEVRRYVFAQFRLWRDQFHTWFGLCIMKSGSIEDEDVKEVILGLAEHIAIEMRESHEQMYRRFLKDMGLTDDAIDSTVKSEATRWYINSFRHEFGDGPDNFFEAVSAISGRELLASLRNSFIIEHFLTPRGIAPFEWLTVHEELELEHFRTAIRPIIQRCAHQQARLDHVVKVMKEEIERHVRYWDLLFEEGRNKTGAAEAAVDGAPEKGAQGRRTGRRAARATGLPVQPEHRSNHK